MAQIYTRLHVRCMDHPHRETQRRCDRCGLPFCDECLQPDRRRPDGTRDWHCRTCVAALAAARARAAGARTFGARLGRARRALGLIMAGLGALGLVGAVVAMALAAAPRIVPKMGARSGAEGQATCGELTRIRSVGAIGLAGPSEVVNVLAYPHRAAVRLLDGASGTGGSGPPSDASGGDLAALVDECDTGWRAGAETRLPVTLVLDIKREEPVWLQRVTLWQDPAAPRSAWVRDFQLLASATADGDDFQPLLLDRPTQLQPSVEQQWFQVVQPPPPGGVSPALLPPEERGRYAQTFPGVIPTRRLLVRILSTYADGEASHRSGPVALGEIAAFGADLEVEISDERTESGSPTGNYAFSTGVRGRAEIRALAGRPVTVLVINRSQDAHTFVTGGQDRNLSLRLERGQAASGVFIASSRPGVFEFSCTLPGHSLKGLKGAIVVR
jgi:plastocyanin